MSAAMYRKKAALEAYVSRPGAQLSALSKPRHLRNLGQPEACHCHVRHFLQCVETHLVYNT